MSAAAEALLFESASRRYRAAGRFAWHFAQGKLRHDPMFRALLRCGVIPDGARVLDLGCGQGLLFALLDTARAQHAAGVWPDGWAAPPRVAGMHGIELRAKDVARARAALGSVARIEQGDLRHAPLDAAEAIVLLDVIHYLEPGAQERLLDRIAAALTPGGVLVARFGDASGGWRSAVTRATDMAVTLARGARPSFHCRPIDAWIATLAARGLAADTTPMSAGTPFANVLVVARRGP